MAQVSAQVVLMRPMPFVQVSKNSNLTFIILSLEQTNAYNLIMETAHITKSALHKVYMVSDVETVFLD